MLDNQIGTSAALDARYHAYSELQSIQIDDWIGNIKVRSWRNAAPIQHHRDLNDSLKTTRAFQVAKIGLD